MTAGTYDVRVIWGRVVFFVWFHLHFGRSRAQPHRQIFVILFGCSCNTSKSHHMKLSQHFRIDCVRDETMHAWIWTAMISSICFSAPPLSLVFRPFQTYINACESRLFPINFTSIVAAEKVWAVLWYGMNREMSMSTGQNQESHSHHDQWRKRSSGLFTWSLRYIRLFIHFILLQFFCPFVPTTRRANQSAFYI